MATLVDRYFSEADLGAIKQAVKDAEGNTSGEIVVMLAPHSKHWLVDRLLSSSFLAVVCLVVSLYLTRESNWGVYYNYSQAALWAIVGFFVGFVALYPLLKLRSRRATVVWRNALRHFSRLRPTRGHTGVLILISLEENEAAIVADKAIAEKLQADYWQQPHAIIVKGMNQGRHAEAIVEGVREIGAQLARFFPRQADDIDELPNAPEIVDT